MTDELPRAAGGGALEFCEVLHWEDLHPGRYGVPEPPEGAKRVSLARSAVVVVPGVAFDRRGGRLGRGQGFYDRALRAARGEPRGEGAGPFVVGLAVSSQLLEEVPVESHDESMDAVVTEREIARVEPGPTAARREPGSR